MKNRGFKGEIVGIVVKEKNMAKDGTLRGGSRPGSGQKKKPLNDRIMEGNLSHRPLKVIELKAADLPVDEVHPKPKEFLSDEQHEVGCRWYAEEIYEATYTWLDKFGCAQLVPPESVERYAMSLARWIQCEEAVSKYGLLSKHPTTQVAIASPLVSMANTYHSQARADWAEIFQVVKENSQGDYRNAPLPGEDAMEQLLRRKRG